MVTLPEMPKRRSDVLDAVHATARGLHVVGAINRPAMREFDRLCRAKAIETAHPPATMTTHDCIVTDPTICNGKPVIRGTRVPVTTVIGSLAGGMTFEEVQREYELSGDDIRAALTFVNELASLASEFFCSRP